ncbi:hypothetical protein A28LD_0055 [Idiomarina sp. A28L]|nr:hypothetical protein A28LD_0055 [Idiomarina sp. A28L]
MFSFSFLEMLVVLGISTSILIWQISAWQLPLIPETKSKSEQKRCSLLASSTHRRLDEMRWFAEQGELVCVN